MKVSVDKWGNGLGIRLPEVIVAALNINENDRLKLAVKDKQIILSKRYEEITMEELFEDYTDKSFQVEIIEFAAMGNEKW